MRGHVRGEGMEVAIELATGTARFRQSGFDVIESPPRQSVGKAVVAGIDRIAGKPSLSAAQTEGVAAILKAMTERIDELTAAVERMAAQTTPAPIVAAEPQRPQPPAKPPQKPRQRRRVPLGRMSRQDAEAAIVDTLKAANGHWPQGVRTLAAAAGTKRTTTAKVLAGLAAAGVIAKTATGLVLLA